MLVEDGETVTPGTPLFEMEEGEGGAAPAAAPKVEAGAYNIILFISYSIIEIDGFTVGGTYKAKIFPSDVLSRIKFDVQRRCYRHTILGSIVTSILVLRFLFLQKKTLKIRHLPFRFPVNSSENN